MRLKKLFLLDMRFQAKDGFYFICSVDGNLYSSAFCASRKLERKRCRNFRPCLKNKYCTNCGLVRK